MTANPNQILDAISDSYQRMYRAEQLRICLMLDNLSQLDDDRKIEKQAVIDMAIDELIGEFDKTTSSYIDHIIQRWVDE